MGGGEGEARGVVDKMTKRFKDILVKNKEACVKRSEIREACKAKRSNMLMVATEKKLKLEEKKTVLEEKKVESRFEEGEDVDLEDGEFG